MRTPLLRLLSLGALSILWLWLCACNARHDGDDPGGGGPPPSSGGQGDGGGPFEQVPECKKVDILFVIDDSGSMADNQKSLIASFPAFIDGMKRRLATAQDYHIGVVTSDTYLHNDSGCTAIGSLVTRTGGPQSSNRVCGPFDGGGRYLTSTDAKLGERFACAAQVGTGGSDDERMARGLLNALAPAARCNAGFRRPDALLVVVMITDEDDVPDGCDGNGACMTYGSGGTPDDWFTEFKRYEPRPENVVVLSLLGRRGDNPCGAVPASRLIGFTNRFGKNGFLGDICASSYGSFFESALPLIQDACKVFIPLG